MLVVRRPVCLIVAAGYSNTSWIEGTYCRCMNSRAVFEARCIAALCAGSGRFDLSFSTPNSRSSCCGRARLPSQDVSLIAFPSALLQHRFRVPLAMPVPFNEPPNSRSHWHSQWHTTRKSSCHHALVSKRVKSRTTSGYVAGIRLPCRAHHVTSTQFKD